MSLKAFSLGLILGISACGRENKSDAAAAEAPKRLNSFAVVDQAALPECNESQFGALAYTTKEEEFFTCNAEKTWTVIEIKANKGLEIESVWQYHLDSLEDAKELANETGSLMAIRLGTVRLTQYANGSGFISILGGAASSYETGHGDTVSTSDEFSHPFILAATAEEQIFVVKLGDIANYRARYKITLGKKPIFKAVVDIDGNFADNTDIEIPLEKQ